MNIKVKCKSDSEDIRIYFNKILHLRLPRDKNMILQSWIELNSRSYIIEIRCFNYSDKVVYENKSLWKKVLKELDNNI